MKNFWEGYEQFKLWHETTWNIVFHGLTSLFQMYFVIEFLFTFNLWYILFTILIPYITDGIGHLFERNFLVVLQISKAKNSTNSSGVNGFYNFLYKLIALFELSFHNIKK